jgi:predicted  nucleic acid-binding Zn-ribbon protein
MALKDDLARLYQLQLVDSSLARVEAELAGLDDGSRAARRAHAAQAATEEAVRQLREAEAHLKDRELALASAEAERQAKSQRAFGGTVTDGKELTALERKLEELDRRKGTLEEEVLGLYEAADQLRQAETEARKHAHELVQRAKQLRAEYQTRHQELEAEQAKFAAQRAELAAPLPAPLLEQYDRLRANNQGVGIAAIVSGACDFCHTRTPNEALALARHGTQLVRCESCAAILVPPN